MLSTLEFIGLCLIAIIALTTAAVTEDEVTSLPYLDGPLPSAQYSGYLSFEDPDKVDNTIFYHYWFSVAETDDPTSAPLIYWSNGGPGCSSMEGTFFEGGAFNLNLGNNGTVTVTVNPNRWTRFANVLYFETPVGVGFSYNSDNSYSDNNDENTAQRNLAAMRKFFESYSEFKNASLYFAGESYAGIYLPALAKEVIEDSSWNGGELLGIAVGNGCTGAQTGVCANNTLNKCNQVVPRPLQMLQYPYIPPTIRNNLEANNCTSQLEACLYSDGNFPDYAVNASVSQTCIDIMSEVEDIYFGNPGPGAINAYGVELECFENQCEAAYGQKYESLYEKPKAMYVTDRVGGSVLNGINVLSKWRSKEGSTLSLEKRRRLGDDDYSYNLITSMAPCIDSSAMSAYFNDPVVQDAIHVVAPGFCYQVCGKKEGFEYDKTQADNADTYNNYLIPRIHVVIYNGIEDLVVPNVDNYRWTKQIGLPVATTNGTGNHSVPEYWKHWYYTEQKHNTKQLGGFYIRYNTSSIAESEHSGFTYNMVANAGHQVPFDAPRPALEFFAWFVNQDIPLDAYPYPPDVNVVNDTIYVNETIYVDVSDDENKLNDADVNGIVFGTTAAVLFLMYLTYIWTRRHVAYLIRQETENANRSNVIGASFNTTTSNPLTSSY